MRHLPKIAVLFTVGLLSQTLMAENEKDSTTPSSPAGTIKELIITRGACGADTPWQLAVTAGCGTNFCFKAGSKSIELWREDGDSPAQLILKKQGSDNKKMEDTWPKGKTFTWKAENLPIENGATYEITVGSKPLILFNLREIPADLLPKNDDLVAFLEKNGCTQQAAALKKEK